MPRTKTRGLRQGISSRAGLVFSDFDQYLTSQYPPAALTQLRWIRKSRVPSFMLAVDPLDVVYVVPNVHAHLSAFSMPRRSYHAFRSGSVTASSSSCEM